MQHDASAWQKNRRIRRALFQPAGPNVARGRIGRPTGLSKTAGRLPKTVFTMLSDDSFRELLDFFDLSWSGYRKVRKGVKKRLHRHMQQLNCRRVSDYLDVLAEDGQCRRVCRQLLTVSISRFFRDRRLWHSLEHDLLPEIVTHYPDSLRVWSAGCAAGEEPYSFKILWSQLQRKLDSLPDLYMLATDTSTDTLSRARAGVYRAGSLKEMPAESIPAHFTTIKKGRSYRIRPALQRGIIWMQHDLLDEPPRTWFHLILLRNSLLTYYKDSLQQAAMGRILKQLSRPGWLIVGARESCPAGTSEMHRHPDAPGVYLKQ